MKISALLLCTVSTLVLGTSMLRADAPIPNRLIDYAGFQKIVDSSQGEREVRRLTEVAFLKMMADPTVVILDARSSKMYQLRHIKNAVNLPFTDFTAATLAHVLPAKDTTVLIYCNNNFVGAPVSFASKTATASLNLSTYTSLKSYGYTHIYELGPLLDVATTQIPFEGAEVSAKAASNAAEADKEAAVLAPSAEEIQAERCAN